MYNIIITDKANKDLDDIVNYIKNDLRNGKAASDFIDEVIKCLDYLAEQPKMFSICSEANLNAKGYRKIKIKNYLAIYKVDDEEQLVTVMRFCYDAMNYFDLF